MAVLQDYLNIVQGCIPTYPTLNTAQIIQQVNLARNRVALWTNCTKSTMQYPLTANTSTYPLSTIFGNVIPTGIEDIWVWFGNFKYQLEKGTIDSYVLPMTAYPVKYWLSNQSIVFYPAPSQAYNTDIVYTYQPVALVNTTDIDNDIPTVYAQAVGYLAASNSALLDANMQLSQAYEQLAKQVIQEVNPNRW